MQIDTQSLNDAALVYLPEQLLMKNAAVVRSELLELIRNGETRLLFDLNGVGFIDSSGLSVLVSTFKALQAVDGSMALLSPSDAVRSLIELTRLHEIFDIYEDRDAALDAFCSDAGVLS